MKICYKGMYATQIVLKNHSFLTPFKPKLNNRIDLTISFNSKKICTQKVCPTEENRAKKQLNYKQ
jgi:hypothetical protein